VNDVSASSGLIQVWQQGDGVTRFVALLLLAMSLASWVVMVLKTLDVWQLRRQARQVENFWNSASIQQGLQALGPQQVSNAYRHLAEQAEQALAHVQRHDATPHVRDGLDVSDWVTRVLQNALDHTMAQLQSGLILLASVGSTAPFVGLFGTVWGIYHALMGIGQAGQATIDQVAGPIGEALIMTALGLAVAIPAVLGYNALVRANKTALVSLKRFAHDLHALQVTGARVTPR
jgi:biopolymer transport protein ExbB